MKYPCIESTIEIPIKTNLLRVWIDQVIVKEGYENDSSLAHMLRRIFKMKISLEEKIDLAKRHEPNISAVQYIYGYRKHDRARYGVVVYLTDFNVTVHG